MTQHTKQIKKSFLFVESKVKLFDDRWNQKIGLSYIKNVRKNSFDTLLANPYYSKSFYDGRKYKLDWQNDFQLGKFNLLTAGIEFEREESESEYLYYKFPDTLVFQVCNLLIMHTSLVRTCKTNLNLMNHFSYLLD